MGPFALLRSEIVSNGWKIAKSYMHRNGLAERNMCITGKPTELRQVCCDSFGFGFKQGWNEQYPRWRFNLRCVGYFFPLNYTMEENEINELYKKNVINGLYKVIFVGDNVFSVVKYQANAYWIPFKNEPA